MKNVTRTVRHSVVELELYHNGEVKKVEKSFYETSETDIRKLEGKTMEDGSMVCKVLSIRTKSELRRQTIPRFVENSEVVERSED